MDCDISFDYLNLEGYMVFDGISRSTIDYLGTRI